MKVRVKQIITWLVLRLVKLSQPQHSFQPSSRTQLYFLDYVGFGCKQHTNGIVLGFKPGGAKSPLRMYSELSMHIIVHSSGIFVSLFASFCSPFLSELDTRGVGAVPSTHISVFLSHRAFDLLLCSIIIYLLCCVVKNTYYY